MTPGIALADAIAALVAEKRAVGYKYAAEARVLARFEAFCRSEFPGQGTVTQVSVPSILPIEVCLRRSPAMTTLRISLPLDTSS